MSKSAPPKRIKAILFDLGKVLVNFNFEPAFQRLSKACPYTSKEIEGYFLNSGLEVLYDGGKISSFKFYTTIKKSLRHNLNFSHFKKIWNEVFTPNTPMISLVKRLEPRYRLVMISNTNPMHYEYLRARYSVFNHFDRIILSYKEKIRKPDGRIYRTAARACKALPQEIFYIDDRSDLTEAAESLGFHTFTFKNNPKDLMRSMTKHGILN